MYNVGTLKFHRIPILLAIAGITPILPLQSAKGTVDYNVRDFGAKGDGLTLDTSAINHTIEAAAAAGGGEVVLPAGNYLSTSIELKSNIRLQLDSGATLLAAPVGNGVGYDAAEPNEWNRYQDFGHSHFHNSLIWGQDLVNVSITGQGQIWGKGLVRDFTKEPSDGNKAIALYRCKNVLIRDVTIRHGGWFGILATGVDHFTLDNLMIDTNRDGMDIDCCRDVHVSNCSVNSPNDDGICLKSSFALGAARATENVSITNCHVSGFKEGSLLDGTYIRKGYPTGRIKFGTESNGGFKNIAISNCVFDYSRGLALETVDGGFLEDVTITNITMRDIVSSPIFLRLGGRMRGPAGTPNGKLQRITIDGVRVFNAAEASIIAGVPGCPVEDIRLRNIWVDSKGGAPANQADIVPKEDVKGYPEPEAFGKLPANCFYVRHAKSIEFADLEFGTTNADARPPFLLDDVEKAAFTMLKPRSSSGTSIFRLKSVHALSLRMVEGLKDSDTDYVQNAEF